MSNQNMQIEFLIFDNATTTENDTHPIRVNAGENVAKCMHVYPFPEVMHAVVPKFGK